MIVPVKSALPDIAGAATRLSRDLFDMVLPVTCPACDAPITGSGGLCASCWGKLELVSDPVCDVYGAPMTFDAGDAAISARAVRNPPQWARARGAVIFNDTSQHLVHALKYRDRHEVVATMARMMWHAGREVLKDAELIVPVPLHRWRLWSRRYNQSALLVAELGKLSGIPVKADLVSRVRTRRLRSGWTAFSAGAM
jgi:predicted amidophosphoribosyltransferase